MAVPTIGSLIDGIFKDDVLIFDSSYNQVLKDAKISKLEVHPRAQLMRHPVETGVVITDYRIVQPTEISIGLFVQFPDYKDTYRELRELFAIGAKLIIQTKSAVYPNQIIAAIPHQESPDAYNALIIALSLKEVIEVVSGLIESPSDPQDLGTVQKGTLQGADPSDARVTIAENLHTAAGGAI